MAKGTLSARRPLARPVYQAISVIGPSAGVDLRNAATLVEPTRARRLVNWSLSEPGALTTRKGYRAFSTSSLGTGRIQGGARLYFNTAIPAANSTARTVVVWAGGLYVQEDDGTWLSTTAALSGLSTSNQIHFASDRDVSAVFDGSTTPWKSTNGSSWTKMGIQPPSTSPSLSTLSTGGMSSGEYQIGFTYKDRDLAIESDGSSSPSTITLSASSGAINVIVPNSTEARVDAVVIYARKVSASETVRRRISSGAVSTGANSTFVVTSTNWTTADEEPSNHTPPVALSFGVVWKNRWWARDAAVTNRIRFTEIFQPESWPALFYVDIPFDRGDGVEAMIPLGDTLIVFGASRVFVIAGQTSLDFEVRPSLASQDGALGQRAVAAVEGGVLHAAASGVYTFDGASDQLLSYDIEPAWRAMMDNALAADIAAIAVAAHMKEKEVRLAVPYRYPSTTYGEWVLDLNRTRTSEKAAWTATDRTIGGYIGWVGPEKRPADRDRLFSWHSSSARLFEESTGTTANSSNLSCEYEGPGLTLGAHRGRWVDISGEYEPAGGSLTVSVAVDGLSMGSQGVSIGASGAVYGTASYGTATYPGTSRRRFHRMLPIGAEGRTATVTLVYGGTERFRIFDYHLGVVPEVEPRQWSE